MLGQRRLWCLTRKRTRVGLGRAPQPVSSVHGGAAVLVREPHATLVRRVGARHGTMGCVPPVAPCWWPGVACCATWWHCDTHNRTCATTTAPRTLSVRRPAPHPRATCVRAHSRQRAHTTTADHTRASAHVPYVAVAHTHRPRPSGTRHQCPAHRTCAAARSHDLVPPPTDAGGRSRGRTSIGSVAAAPFAHTHRPFGAARVVVMGAA